LEQGEENVIGLESLVISYWSLVIGHWGTTFRNPNQMNFLAHLYLSGKNEELLLGNFIADAVKGKQYEQFPEAVQKGILLHRQIDTYTDTHPVVELSKARLRSRYHKYAPVIVDVYYDHFLAANWNEFSEEPLQSYSQNIYQLILGQQAILPEKSRHFSTYMIRYNILEAYSRLEGIEKVLKGMSQRARFDSGMETAVEELEEHYSLFENEFRLFFTDLRQFVNDKLIFP
jgi:acyl carrier protein phosphodiesterase